MRSRTRVDWLRFNLSHLFQANFHFLGQSFESALNKLVPTHPSQLSLDLVLKPSQLISPAHFTITNPPTAHDQSTAHQSRLLELAFAQLSSDFPSSSTPTPLCREAELRRKGALELAERTGRRARVGGLAGQLLKLRRANEVATDDRQRSESGAGSFDQTAHILLESNLLASLLTGR